MGGTQIDIDPRYEIIDLGTIQNHDVVVTFLLSWPGRLRPSHRGQGQKVKGRGQFGGHQENREGL